MVEYNKKIVESRGESFDVDYHVIKKIVARMDKFDNIANRRTRIVKKAATIMAGICFDQPFFEGNKETALDATIGYLNNNSFDLKDKSQKEKKEIYELLVKTVFKFPGDKTIFQEVEEYLDRNIVSLT